MEEWNNEKISKKSSLVLKMVIGIVVILLIGMVVIFSQPTLKNQLYLTVLSPKNYYLKTELNNVENIAGDLVDLYEKEIDKIQNTKTQEKGFDIKFDLAKNYKDELELDTILPIQIGANSINDIKNSNQKLGVGLKIAEENLLELNTLISFAKENSEKIYFQFPQFSPDYLYISDKEEDAQDSQEQEYSEYYANYMSNPTSKKFLFDFIVRYGKVFMEGPQNFQVEKNAEYTVNNVTKKMTKIIVSSTAAELEEWGKKLMTTLKNDKELKEEMVRIGIFTEEEYERLFDEVLETYDEEVQDGKLEMVIWVDNKGEIIGREIHVEVEDGENGVFYYHTDSQEGIDYFEAAVVAEGKDSGSLEVKGNKKKEESGYRGDILIEIKEDNKTETNFKIKFDGIIPVDKEYGSYNGKIVLESDYFYALKIQTILEGGENSQNIKLDLLAGNTSICSLENNYYVKESEGIVYPPEGKAYDADKTEELQKYLKGLDKAELEKLKAKLKVLSEVGATISGKDNLEESISNMFEGNLSESKMESSK